MGENPTRDRDGKCLGCEAPAGYCKCGLEYTRTPPQGKYTDDEWEILNLNKRIREASDEWGSVPLVDLRTVASILDEAKLIQVYGWPKPKDAPK